MSRDMLKDDEDAKGGLLSRPLCPFCSEPWTDDMIKMFYDEENWGSDSMGSFTSVNWVLEITCGSCKKPIYRKEGEKIF